MNYGCVSIKRRLHPSPGSIQLTLQFPLILVEENDFGGTIPTELGLLANISYLFLGKYRRAETIF
jgi:hypothetical protein